MLVLGLYLFMLFIYRVSSDCCIELHDTGTDKMTPGDVGMVLWINLKNVCDEKFHINVKMLQCIENIGDAEQETSGMYLIGGYMGVSHAKSIFKATLIYPNMYLYNRKGYCSIIIHYTDDRHITGTLRGKIKFNTIPHDGIAPLAVKSFYKTSRSLRPCETPDLDPLENCAPVDCMMKFLGVRNYYNDRWKRCQKVPACVSDGMKDDPDVLLLKCNNGRLDNTTGICKCKEGYMSAEPDIENYIPGLTVYHMCNIKVDSWNKANLPKLKTTILGFATLAVVIVMLILLLTFCCYGIYAYVRSYEENSPFVSSNSSDIAEFDDCDGAVQYDMNRMMRYCS